MPPAVWTGTVQGLKRNTEISQPTPIAFLLYCSRKPSLETHPVSCQGNRAAERAGLWKSLEIYVASILYLSVFTVDLIKASFRSHTFGLFYLKTNKEGGGSMSELSSETLGLSKVVWFWCLGSLRAHKASWLHWKLIWEHRAGRYDTGPNEDLCSSGLTSVFDLTNQALTAVLLCRLTSPPLKIMRT